MTLFVICVLALIGAIVFSGVTKAKARMHYANSRQAERNTLEAIERSEHKMPSWAEDATKAQIFAETLPSMLERRGIPKAYFGLMMANRDWRATLMTYVSSLEGSGSSFLEQQVGATEFIDKSWRRIPSEDRLQFQKLGDVGGF